MTGCHSFTSQACVDGTCLIAQANEHPDRADTSIRDCRDCGYYSGECADCIFEGASDICPDALFR